MIAIPKEYANKSHDLVSYYYKQEGCDEKFLDEAACYATCMKMLPKCSYKLVPKEEKSQLPYDLFCKYIELCKENKIVIKECETQNEENKNILIVPRNNYNKHLVYTTLCCYRWSENQAGTPYAIIKTLEQNPEIDFFQAFHYGLLHAVYWTLHSFTFIANKSILTTKFNNSQLNIANSIAIAKLFRDEKIEDCGYETISKVDDYASCLKRKLGSSNIKNIEDLLDPKLKILYTSPDLPDNYKEIIDPFKEKENDAD